MFLQKGNYLLRLGSYLLDAAGIVDVVEGSAEERKKVVPFLDEIGLFEDIFMVFVTEPFQPGIQQEYINLGVILDGSDHEVLGAWIGNVDERVIVQEIVDILKIGDLDFVQINESQEGTEDLHQVIEILGLIKLVQLSLKGEFLVLFSRKHALDFVLLTGHQIPSLELRVVIKLSVEGEVIEFGEQLLPLTVSGAIVQLFEVVDPEKFIVIFTGRLTGDLIHVILGETFSVNQFLEPEVLLVKVLVGRQLLQYFFLVFAENKTLIEA